jgi:hypothetical protein
MRKLGIVLAALALIVFAFWLRRALASDETRIRWVIEGMVAGFNDERNAGAMRGFAKEYRDETSGVDRELVHAGLAHLFFTRRDPDTKRFDLRLEVPRVELAIGVADVVHARARGLLRRWEGAGARDDEAPERLVWEVRFDGELVDVDGDWRFTSSTHDTLAGLRPR